MLLIKEEAIRPKGGVKMRTYEIMFIVRPDLEADAIKEVVKKYSTLLVQKKATIKKEEGLGQRELAYEIKKHKSGFYYLMQIETDDSKAIEEFERLVSIDNDIIRHMIIRIEE